VLIGRCQFLWLAAGTLLHSGLTQAAERISENTACAAVPAIMDGNDRSRKIEVIVFIQNAFEKFDRTHTEVGEPGIMAALSDNGLSGLVAMASVKCRNMPRLTIYNSASQVYRGIRDLQIEMGTAR
jgi:hypothetical protein